MPRFVYYILALLIKKSYYFYVIIIADREYGKMGENEMKKIVLVTLLCISVTIGLCACEGQGNSQRDFADMTENYVPLGPVVE